VTLTHRLEAVGLRIAMGALKALPTRLGLSVGTALGEVAFRLGVRKRVVLENLENAEGIPRDPIARERIARAAYRNYGRSVAEYMQLEGVPDARSADRIDYEGLDHVREALSRGKGVIAVSGHFGSLDLLASGFRAIGAHPTVLAAPMRNPIAARVFKSHWERCGLGVIEVGPGLRDAFGVLERNGLLCFAADQDAGKRGVFVSFLGRPASTPRGPIELSLRTGAPVVFGLIFRRGSKDGIDRHLVRIDPPFVVELEGTREQTVQRHVQHLMDRLAAGILEQPDQWFWFHRRWKTQPVREIVATSSSTRRSP